MSKKSVAELKALALEGNTEAQTALGLLYELGLEVESDSKEAAKYWGMAAKSGDPFAQFSLGQLIEREFEDTEENRLMSQALLKKAESFGFIKEDKALRLLEQQKGQAVRVLIVDDSEMIRVRLRLLFEQDGCEVFDAENGNQALKLLKSTKDIKIIFSDVNMPGMDGMELVRLIRQMPEHLELPIVMITTESRADYVILGKELGVQGWLIKPAKGYQLRAMLQKLL